MGVATGAVRILGRTDGDAVVAVNGRPVDVSVDGAFQTDVVLAEGVNTIQTTATAPSGAVARVSRVVFFTSPTEALPMSLFYPRDGLVTSEPTVQIMGGTRQDAVVGVNGSPVPVNELGIFSADVPLEAGANVVEVVATDLEGNINFQTVVVFYEP
jgi:uncharacterized protein YfaP (DUF2135 family)